MIGCPDCSETSGVAVVFHDEGLREHGAFTVACEACGHELYVPAESRSRSRIGALRAIVRDHSAARVDGYIVDAFTASMLVKVYDALSPENRERFGKPDLLRLVDLGWKHVRAA